MVDSSWPEFDTVHVMTTSSFSERRDVELWVAVTVDLDADADLGLGARGRYEQQGSQQQPNGPHSS